MALPVITQEEILERRMTPSFNKDVVMLVNPECAGCAHWESLVEQIVPNYTGESQVDTISFYKLVVYAEELPIFAPPVVPSIIALENGYRMFEVLGSMETTGPLEIMIDNWIEGRIDIDTVSGGESIAAM